MDKIHAMDKKEKKAIITKDDVLVGSIHTLTHTKDIQLCMNKSVNELILRFKSTFEDNERAKN